MQKGLTDWYVLNYNPYISREENPKISRKEFYDHLRYIPASLHDIKNNLTLSVTPGNYFKQIIVFYGFSGNGKTTFFKWLKFNLKTNNIFFEIINPLDYYSASEHSEDFILNAFYEFLVYKLKKRSLLKLIINNEDTFVIRSKLINRNCFNNIRDIYYNNPQDPIPLEEIEVLVDNLDFKANLGMYIIAKLYSLNNEGKSFNSHVFCFDNLDEIKYEYLSEKIWNDFQETINMLETIFLLCEELRNIEFKDNCSFILVFRESTFAISNYSQARDRLQSVIKEIHFIAPNIQFESLKKRKEFINNNVYIKSRLYYNLSCYCADSIITKEVLLPMFNYDLRHFSLSIRDISEPTWFKNKQYHKLNLNFREYKDIEEKYRYLFRGEIINGYIKYFKSDDFMYQFAAPRPLSPNKPHCNYGRILLTILSNASYPYGFYDYSNDDLQRFKAEKISLIRLYKQIENIIPTRKLIYLIKSFFNINEPGWKHFLSIYGKTPEHNNGRYILNFDNEEKALIKLDEGINLSANEEKILNNTSVKLNPSGYIYLRNIIIHFEYFSCYKTVSDKSWFEDISLVKSVFFDFKDSRWKFESIIMEVFEHVETYSKNMELFYSKKYENERNYTKENFCRSQFIFKSPFEKSNDQISQELEEVNNLRMFPFYVTRLISSHVVYIEQFRHYILEHQDKIRNEFPDAMRLKGKSKIQEFLIQYLIKYLELNKSFNDPATNYYEPLLSKAITIKNTNNWDIWIYDRN